MNYQIIADEQALEDFVNFLPNTSEDEKFYIALFARKKYTTDERFRADKTQLKRLVCRKQDIISNLKKLEVKDGLYKFHNIEIPQEMLAVYLNPNPRSMSRSSLELMARMSRDLRDGKTLKNPKSEAMNCIQVTHSRKVYFDVDLDIKPDRRCSLDEVIDWVQTVGFINLDAMDNIVETRGGFHVLVNLNKISPKHKNTWYKGFSETNPEMPFTTMMNSDNVMPVPGCVQGGFVPILHNNISNYAEARSSVMAES